MEKGSGMAIGIGIGVMMGAIFGGFAIWIGVGVVLGVLIENGDLDEFGFDSWRCGSEK